MVSAGGGSTAGGGTTAPPSTPTPAPPTCNCPPCPEGAACAPCDCPIIVDACGAETDESGCLSVTTARCLWHSYGAACGDVRCVTGYCYRDTTPIDPCVGHLDAASCQGDVADSCAWIEMGVACVKAPCPTGSCIQMKPVSGGCACACPTCVAGESCPPCACDCCGAPLTAASP
jgi:hypothetical protein